jgi:NDP-hexose 4-ketoreductase
MTRVLVVGADGFLGTHAVRALTAAGAVVVPAPPREDLDLAVAGPGELVSLLRDARPDAVVNAAGLVTGSPEELEQGNGELVRRLLRACAAAVPGVRLVHLGSLAEYGSAAAGVGGGWAEDGPAEPVSPYGAAKLRATRAVLDASRGGQVDGCVLRVANPVGAGQPASSLVGAVIGQLRDAPDDGVRLGPLDGRRDVVSARDVGRAIAAAALLPDGGLGHRLINIGSGFSVPMRDVVHSVLRLAGSRGGLIEGTSPGSARSSAVLDAVADVRRAAEVLGWVAADDLESAVRDALRGAGLLQHAS